MVSHTTRGNSVDSFPASDRRPVPVWTRDRDDDASVWTQPVFLSTFDPANMSHRQIRSFESRRPPGTRSRSATHERRPRKLHIYDLIIVFTSGESMPERRLLVAGRTEGRGGGSEDRASDRPRPTASSSQTGLTLVDTAYWLNPNPGSGPGDTFNVRLGKPCGRSRG